MSTSTICAVCRRVLNTGFDETGATYQHALQDQPADHEPRPVRVADERAALRCDFCSVDVIKPHIINCRPFSLDEPVTGLMQTYDAPWAACNICAEAIMTADWKALYQRSVDRYQQIAGEPIHPIAGHYLARLQIKVRETKINVVMPTEY